MRSFRNPGHGCSRLTENRTLNTACVARAQSCAQKEKVEFPFVCDFCSSDSSLGQMSPQVRTWPLGSRRAVLVCLPLHLPLTQVNWPVLTSRATACRVVVRQCTTLLSTLAWQTIAPDRALTLQPKVERERGLRTHVHLLSYNAAECVSQRCPEPHTSGGPLNGLPLHSNHIRGLRRVGGGKLPVSPCIKAADFQGGTPSGYEAKNSLHLTPTLC